MSEQPPENADATESTDDGKGRARRDRAERDRPSEEPEPPGPPPPTPVGPPLTQQVGRIAVGVLAVLFGVFAVTNLQFVDFHWIFGGTEVLVRGGERAGGGVPLIVLLVGSFVIGAVTGWFATWWLGRSRGRARRPQ